MQLSEDEIKRRQRNMKQKKELLEELGLEESLSSALYMIEDESIRETIERHDDSCSYNACPIDFLTYGIDEKGKLVRFRTYISGDPASRCSLDRETREKIYASLPPVLQALLPNKALAEYEIREDKKLAAMTPEEREAYLKAKEESRQQYIARMNALKNKQQSP